MYYLTHTLPALLSINMPPSLSLPLYLPFFFPSLSPHNTKAPGAKAKAKRREPTTGMREKSLYRLLRCLLSLSLSSFSLWRDWSCQQITYACSHTQRAVARWGLPPSLCCCRRRRHLHSLSLRLSRLGPRSLILLSLSISRHKQLPPLSPLMTDFCHSQLSSSFSLSPHFWSLSPRFACHDTFLGLRDQPVRLRPVEHQQQAARRRRRRCRCWRRRRFCLCVFDLLS